MVVGGVVADSHLFLALTVSCKCRKCVWGSALLAVKLFYFSSTILCLQFCKKRKISFVCQCSLAMKLRVDLNRF